MPADLTTLVEQLRESVEDIRPLIDQVASLSRATLSDEETKLIALAMACSVGLSAPARQVLRELIDAGEIAVARGVVRA